MQGLPPLRQPSPPHPVPPLQEKRLVRLSEEGDDSHVERLKVVYQELQAMGADQAEPKARRILAVSGTLTWHGGRRRGGREGGSVLLSTCVSRG